MSDSGTWIEIVLLAMLAGFIGLRLVSVLGKRTGHEKPAGERFMPGQAEVVAPRGTVTELRPRGPVAVPSGTDAALAPALQTLADADASFDPAKFMAGAQAAYRMVLEAFWAGDATAMDGLMSDEVATQFRSAIAERGGGQLDNKLTRIDGAQITAAQMIGQMAEVTVRFDAEIVSGTDAAPTHDLWTFSRHVGSADPAWLLIATDTHA